MCKPLVTNQNPPWRPWEVWTLSLGTRAAAVKWTQWNTWPQAVTTSHQYLTAVSLYVRAWAYVGPIVTSQSYEINKNFLTKHKFWNIFVDVEVLEPSSWPGETRPTRELFLELSGSQPHRVVTHRRSYGRGQHIHYVIHTLSENRSCRSDSPFWPVPVHHSGSCWQCGDGVTHTPEKESHRGEQRLPPRALTHQLIRFRSRLQNKPPIYGQTLVCF